MGELMREEILNFTKQSPAYMDFLIFLEARTRISKISDMYSLRQYSGIQFEPDFPIGKFFEFLASLKLGKIEGRKFHWKPDSGALAKAMGGTPGQASIRMKHPRRTANSPDNIYAFANQILSQSKQLKHDALPITRLDDGNPILLCIIAPTSFSDKETARSEIANLEGLLESYKETILRNF